MELSDEIKTLLNSISDGVYVLNFERNIIFWNTAAEIITGFTAKEVCGKSCSENILRHIDKDGKELCLNGCPMERAINERIVVENDVYLHHKEGYRLMVHIKGFPWYSDGKQIGAMEIFSPVIFHHYELRENLIKFALLDPLTNVYNRRGFEGIFGLRFLEMQRNRFAAGLLFFDIDNFKKLNDTYGHDFGDAVLKTVAQTFTNNVRSYDIVARWGGEEFIVVVFVNQPSMTIAIAQNLCQLIASGFLEHENLPVHFSVSCGATLIKNQEQMNEAIHRADELMYRAKRNGKNQVCADFD